MRSPRYRRAPAAILLLMFAATSARAEVASRAERDFERTLSPLTAQDITGNLIRNIGTHVAFVCTVTDIVDRDTMIGQCGRVEEPVDLYVDLPTKGLRVGMKLRVLGEMKTPAQWVDVTGHAWYTAMMKAKYVHRL